MTDAPKVQDRSRPLSVRFSDAEKAHMRLLAAGKPLGQFIRDRALDGQSEPRRANKPIVKEADALGRLLGLLGQSRLASNLNQIAKAANLGAMPVTTELETDLSQACADYRQLR
ncbi:plasmid mobilization protein [Tardiphaga sp. P5_C10]